eukprot:scaffold1380_cov374-Prasinococcus_capsulatus_cf.AAC.2
MVPSIDGIGDTQPRSTLAAPHVPVVGAPCRRTGWVSTLGCSLQMRAWDATGRDGGATAYLEELATMSDLVSALCNSECFVGFDHVYPRSSDCATNAKPAPLLKYMISRLRPCSTVPLPSRSR